LAIHCSRNCEIEPGVAKSLADTEWHSFVADFTDASRASTLFAEVVAHFGRAPDLLVNSASLFGQDRLESVDAASLADHYAVGCAAPALLIQAFSAEAGEGRSIVNVLDQRIDQPHGDQLAYTLAKMALAGLTRISAKELAPRIRVNAVAPGLVLPTEDYSAEQVEHLAAAMPLARLAGPAEIAAAVLYLAGAKSVTGQVLYIDGGARLESYARDFMHL
jgi:NAD(P)-dependent dehydrogenase (short-subunit alcohol dehydrogenase family)